MPTTLLLILPVLSYLLAAGLIARQISHKVHSENTDINLSPAYMLGTVATGLHLLYALSTNSLTIPLNISLSAMATSVSVILVIIFLLGCLFLPIRRLGMLVFPFAALSLVFSAWWGGEANIVSNAGLAFNVHIMVSILSYSLLTIATIQALLFFYQERAIKNPRSTTMLMAMPPLQTMELLLFQLVSIGFVLLTITLVSGAMFSQQIFGQAFEFKHHTILASLGWLVFAVLLFKRFTSGLRGTQAVAWTITGFILIQLGYFGTKIVSESLNIQ